MPISTEAPLRLPSQTKEKVQLAAAILGLKQAELVTHAVNEFLETHSHELGEKLVGAQAKLGVVVNGRPR
jgi:hypothetical protein